MVGGQHRAAGFPVRSALKSGLFWLKLLVVVILPLAVLGLDIYMVTSGAYMEVMALSWLIALTSLTSSIIRRRDAFSCWTGAALVLLIAAQLAGIYGHHVGWPGADAVSQLRDGTLVAGVACFAVATLIGGQAGIRWWRRRHTRA
jgi:hypothetical protein